MYFELQFLFFKDFGLHNEIRLLRIEVNKSQFQFTFGIFTILRYLQTYGTDYSNLTLLART